MPLANPTPIDALPPNPTTTDGDAFDAVADAFLGAFPTLRDQINTTSAQTYGNAVVASESGLAAQQAAIAAEQSVAAAAAAAATLCSAALAACCAASPASEATTALP